MILVHASVGASVGLPAGGPVERGFEHFYNLEYDQAVQEFSRAVDNEPRNAAPRNHLAQAILYRAMYRAGALESELVTGSNPFLRRSKVEPTPEEVHRFHEEIQTALNISEARLRENPEDAHAHYTAGVAYGLRANYNFLVRRAWLDSLKDATEARKAHSRATSIDPGFVDAKLVQGVYDYVVGSLPWYYKMLGFIAGYRGDRERGIQILREVAEHGRQNSMDAKVLLAAIYRRERHPEAAIPLLRDLIRRFPRNYLFRLELVQMYSDAGDKESALEVLSRIETLHQSGAPGYARLDPGKIHYARGNLLFWYNDLEAALDDLRRAAERVDEVDLNTGVMAWMRLGQTHDLLGQREEARKAYRQAVDLAPDSEIGKESRRYLSSPYRRRK
ncbi:MAG: tetratricopeptide repeat protein [Bryobacteraceae bacterium]|nr:tetratricopeptide repeat protein [Bryobacteraceae bacterium]